MTEDYTQYVRNGVCFVCGGGVLNSGEHIDPERHTAAVERDAEARGYVEGYRRGYRDRSREKSFNPHQEEAT